MSAKIIELRAIHAERNEAIRKRKYTAIANKMAESPMLWAACYIAMNIITYVVIYKFIIIAGHSDL